MTDHLLDFSEVRLSFAGVTAIESTRSGTTVTAVVAVLPDGVCVAVIVALPAATAVTYPVAASTFAMPGAEEVNRESKVTTYLVSLLYDPVTVSACTPPTSRLTGFGVTASRAASVMAQPMNRSLTTSGRRFQWNSATATKGSRIKCCQATSRKILMPPARLL